MRKSFEVLILLALVAFLGQSGVGQSADKPHLPDGPQTYVPPDPAHHNRFTETNPGYRTRAGRSYEENYLVEAAQSLANDCQFDEGELEQAQAILRGYIYRWLDAFVEAGGTRSELTLQAEEWLDQEFVRSFGQDHSPTFATWKTSPENTLAFLFLAPPPNSLR